MASDIEDDARAKLIKDMIQATKTDLYKFALETQMKLDYILQIVDTNLTQTTVNDRGVQNVEQVLPPLTKKICVRRDLFRAECDTGQGSLQQQQDTIAVDIPIAANNFDQSNTVKIESNNQSEDLFMIRFKQAEPPDNHQSDVCTSRRQNFDMEGEEIAVKQEEQPGRTETTRLNNNQPITENFSKLSTDKDSSESSEDSSGEDGSSDSSEDSVSSDREWLCTVRPVKSPYFPQFGDQVVYIQQCHKAFFEYVSSNKLYEIRESDMPWSQFNLKAHEFAKVIEISYKWKKHTRICCLRLQRTNETGEETVKYFDVEYHYIKDNPYDFIILRQHFRMALKKNWKVDERFRRMFGNKWYFGRILAVQAQDPLRFPDSMFECLRIETDNGSEYNVSPWSIEPIDEENIPEIKGIPVPVTSEDLRKLRYQSRPKEWHQGCRTAICRRVQRNLHKLMQGVFAAPFNKLRNNPTFVSKVEYPIDLEIISARLGNLFYRRVDALEFDIGYLAKNFKTHEIELQSSTDRMGFLTSENQARYIMNCIFASIVEATAATKPARRVKSEISDTEEEDMIGDFSPIAKRRMAGKKSTRCGSSLSKQADQTPPMNVMEVWMMMDKRRQRRLARRRKLFNVSPINPKMPRRTNESPQANTTEKK